MKRIYQHHCTKHFLQKILERRIDPYLISLCIAKGKKISTSKYVLSKIEIKKAILEGYIELEDYIGIETLTLIVKENRLITAFTRFSDIGLNKSYVKARI